MDPAILSREAEEDEVVHAGHKLLASQSGLPGMAPEEEVAKSIVQEHCGNPAFEWLPETRSQVVVVQKTRIRNILQSMLHYQHWP